MDVLRNAYKGDESRVDNACRIADRMVLCILVCLILEQPEAYVMNYQCCSLLKTIGLICREFDEISRRQTNC